MRFKSLKRWSDPIACRSLVIVAQMMDELLFDYTIDTYKPSAMNTSILIQEALQTYSLVDSGSIKSPNLKHVLDELCENINKDIVAQSLIAIDLREVTALLRNPKESNASKLAVVELLHSQVSLVAYKKRTEELLVEEVVSGHREYYIRALVRGYVTTLLNMGFSQRYIREQSQNMFYAFGSNVSSNENIRQFVDVFSHERHDFFVAYRAPDYFEGFSEAAKKIGIDVCKNISGKQTILSRFGFSVRKGGVYLYIDSIIGEDPYTIKSAADRKVDLLQTLIGLYHHKEHPKTILEAVVYNKTLGRGKKINKSKNPMHKCRDLTKEKAAKKLDEFMAGFSMKRDSFQKFNRSAELHALALASDSSENQMINLWIALESLIPSKGEANDKSNIEHVVDSIVPFINLEYICSLVLSFVRDMWRWDSRNFKNALKGISGSDVLSKTVKILALDEFNESKDIIRESCRGYVWLGLRFEYILTIFHSPKSVSDALEAHKVRVGWQIRRIYRARNMMVHEGITPTYIDVLIEHAHDYLDCVMNGVMRLASKANTLNAIDQAFKMAEINYKSYRDGLRVKNENFSQENIEQKIFEKIIR